MADPYIGEIRLMAFGFPPKGWALCNGQLLPIQQNAALFSLLGTTYGGDGRTTFGLPNLQGRMPLHRGPGFNLGQRAGEYSHTLAPGALPPHIHFANGSSADASTVAPVNSLLAANTNMYGPAGSVTLLHGGTLAMTGGGQPHTNEQPYTVINFSIALIGYFPSQS